MDTVSENNVSKGNLASTSHIVEGKVSVMSKIFCKVFGHRWLWRNSKPFELTGTSRDNAKVPAQCKRCHHIPDGYEVSRLAKYEGKP